MATAAKKSKAHVIVDLARSQPDDIARAELVKNARANSPVSVRLSPPLLAALDRLAQKEHRKRGNLIQHVLWEYVRSHPE